MIGDTVGSFPVPKLFISMYKFVKKREQSVVTYGFRCISRSELQNFTLFIQNNIVL